MKLYTLKRPIRRVFAVLTIAIAATGVASAAGYDLEFQNGVAVPGGGACALNLNDRCRFNNVVIGAGTGSANPFQRDVVVTISKLVSVNNVGVVTGATTIGTFDNPAPGLVGTAVPIATATQFFAPSVQPPQNTANITGWAEFTFDFVTPGGAAPAAGAGTATLPGSIWLSSFDTDGNGGTLSEFVEFLGVPVTDTALASPTVLSSGIAVDGGVQYQSGAGQIVGISTDPPNKASAVYTNPASFKVVYGARTGASGSGDGPRLTAFDFFRPDAVLLRPVVDGYKSVKLTTDADGSGNISPGDTLTYTVSYANTGNAAVSNFQIVDALPIGLTATAGAQTVRVNGAVTATAKNALYTGAAGNTNLLAAGQTLAAGGTVSVDIPATVGNAVADNSTLSNQASATVGGASVNSDNVDNTTVFPPSVSAATGFGTVPASSVVQTQAATVDGTTVTVRVPPKLTLIKTVAGRVNLTDQFTVQIKNGATVTRSASTSGVLTSASTGAVTLVSGTTYTLDEIMPTGTLSAYTSGIVCTNTAMGTTLPTGAGQSFTVTPKFNDVITCTLTNTPTPVLADVSISKTGPASLVVGEVGSYTLKVWNQGPSPVTGATIADAVPAGLTNVNWTCTAIGAATCGTASGTGNAISFASGLLPVNTSTGAAGATNAAPTSGDYLTITVTGTATTAGDLINTATVTAPGGVTDGFGANNTASQATRIVPLPFTPTTPAVCSTLPGFTGIGPNLVTAFSSGTFGTSTGDPLVAGSNTKSPTAWPYLATNIPNYGYVQITANSPQDGSLSLVNRMSDPRIFGVWSNTLTPITVSAAGAATSDVTSGRFLLINGSNQGQSIIETTITGLTPNTNYQLTGIFANVIDSGGNQVLPNLNFNIGGASYYKTGDVPQDNNGAAPTAANQAKWRQAGFVFNSGAATSITFAMVSNVPAANGNDFAFDQLGLNQCQGTYVNTLSGFLYSDNNGNASFQNPAEPQLPAGVKVDLQYLDPSGNPVTVAKTTTGLVSGASNTGKYVFTNVPPPPTGFSYFVHVEDGSVTGEPTTIPTGYTLSTVNNAAIAGTPNFVSGTNTGPDFGFTVPQPPAINLLKLGRNVTKNTAFIDGNGSVGVLPGEVVEYCLVYTNSGGVAPKFKITDNVPAGVDAQLGAYAAGKGIRWAAGTTVAVGTTTGTPAGVDLTSASADDQGTLSATGGTNAKGVMTFDLGAAGLAANGQGTVCFQTKVP